MSRFSIKAKLGANIRAARINAEMTQQQLGDVCGVGRVAIANIERGKHYPDWDTYFKIEKALNKEKHELLPNIKKEECDEPWVIDCLITIEATKKLRDMWGDSFDENIKRCGIFAAIKFGDCFEDLQNARMGDEKGTPIFSHVGFLQTLLDLAEENGYF